jgi:hypothetical protein
MVWRLVTTARPASTTDALVNGRRRSGLNVSGSRRKAQMVMPVAAVAGSQNTTRHGAKAFSPAPTPGATMGTSRKTAMIIDISRAMPSPSYRSRIRARLNERGAAAPMPHSTRAAMIHPNVGARLAMMAAMTYTVMPTNSGRRRP